MSQAEFKKRLKVLMNKTENQVCSDCPERQPRWASLIVPPPGSPPGSLPMGAFTCLECSGSHRRLGVHIAFVRSVTLDSWKEKEVLAMENGGNQKVNAIFEANINVSKPTTSATGPVRERFIRDKYERRKYYSAAVLQSYADANDESSDESSEDEHPVKTTTIRAPSEAAKMRAQARKQRSGRVAAPTSTKPSSPRKQGITAPKRRVAKAPAPSADADLLDFGLPVTNDPGPPPKPPSAAPSPTLDMFKELSVGSHTNAQSNVNAPKQNSAVNNNNDRSKKIDDIMGLFNTSNNNNMNFNAFGGMNGMNMSNNMNNAMMMQNEMNGQNTNMSGMMNNQNNNMSGMMNNQNHNMSGMMNNQNMAGMQMMQNSNQFTSNAMMNSFSNANTTNPNANQSMSSQGNGNFFSGMQNNMNGHMSNAGQAQSQMNTGMQMQQTQTNFGGMAPMGGTPTNLSVMGGQGMNNQQQPFGVQNEPKDNSGFDFMGGSATGNNGGDNPQMNQFASFGSFR